MDKRRAKALVGEKATIEARIVMHPFVLVRAEYKHGSVILRSVAMAKCSPKDCWSDWKGIEIAFGRAKAGIIKALLAGNFLDSETKEETDGDT